MDDKEGKRYTGRGAGRRRLLRIKAVQPSTYDGLTTSGGWKKVKTDSILSM
jgi:hypothetical protein